MCVCVCLCVYVCVCARTCVCVCLCIYKSAYNNMSCWIMGLNFSIQVNSIRYCEIFDYFLTAIKFNNTEFFWFDIEYFLLCIFNTLQSYHIYRPILF